MEGTEPRDAALRELRAPSWKMVPRLQTPNLQIPNCQDLVLPHASQSLPSGHTDVHHQLHCFIMQLRFWEEPRVIAVICAAKDEILELETGINLDPWKQRRRTLI